MNRLFAGPGICIIAFASMVLPAAAGNNIIVKFDVKAPYEDVVQDLEGALTDAGLVVNFTAHVVNMLNRTAADVGATKTVYKRGRVIEFCSASLSRAAVEADPVNMAYCPYTMFVYQTIARPNVVTVGYRRLTGATDDASKAALARVNSLLDKMVREAAGVE